MGAMKTRASAKDRQSAWLFLRVWADTKKSREDGGSAAPYVGNIDAGTYRPKDDPHPHAFVMCQVETLLGLRDRKLVARVERSAQVQFRQVDPEIDGFVDELALAISDRRYSSLVDSIVAEQRTARLLEVRRKNADRVARHRELKRNEACNAELLPSAPQDSEHSPID